jgi:hypothetical protein
MSDQQITCMVCHVSFIYSEREQQFLDALYREGKIDEVCAPKRCDPCRQRKKHGLKASPAPPPAPLPFRGYVNAPPAFQTVVNDLPLSPREELRNVEYEETPPPLTAPVQPSVKYDPAPIEPDIRCVLVAGDFEKLVCREEVVLKLGNRKVTLVLANIGLPAMKAAMEKAVLAWWRS